MKLSTTWIQEWLRRTISEREIVEGLERAGLEIEQYIASTPIDKKIVVGLVKKVVQHPQADRLKLVEVSTGDHDVRVVCGAPNVREGMKVALAQVGTTLPSGDTIQTAKLRGEVSEGMLCSEYELGLGNDHNGILELSSESELGIALCDIYPADGIVDVKTPANRFDVLSVVGLAREVAAMTDNQLSGPLPKLPELETAPELVAPGAAAARFMVMRVPVGDGGHAPSPTKMTARLRAAGVRPISPIVDVTNYVNLELGQPLHAYDAAKVRLPLEVRQARAGETLVTLDGVTRKLTAEDLVVADQSGPVGLAGVMGGAGTEVDETTREILLEVATFDSTVVRKMAKRHGLRTEASARFERGLPVELAPVALARAAELLEEMTGGKPTALADQLNRPTRVRQVELPLELLNRLLGFSVTAKEAAAALARLEIQAEADGEAVVVPALPWWRTDILEAQDLVEEVVRVLGYDRVPATIPTWRPERLEFDRERPVRRRLQQVLYAAGLFEVMTYSFVSQEQLEGLGLALKKHLKLQNPLSSEQAYLRSGLLASHLAVLARNRAYGRELGFYELSRVFVAKGPDEQPAEPLRLAVTVLRPADAYRHLKGILDALAEELAATLTVEPAEGVGLAPGRGAAVSLDGTRLGQIGQLNPALLQREKLGGEAAYLELDVEPLWAAAGTRQFAGRERFPSTGRDVAVILPESTTWQDVRAALDDLPNTQVSFVNDYYGAELPSGRKSLALRLTVSHPDRTPTEVEAAEVERKALAVLKRKFEAEPRA